MRSEFRYGLLAAAVVLLAACGGKKEQAAEAPKPEDKVLFVYNWSDYIGETTIADFEAKTGIKVTYDVFDSNEVLETKLLAGRTGYDVVVPSANFLERQIKAGVFLPLDKSKLPNLVNMDPDIMQRVAAHDPGNKYAINYLWGTTGIGYNPDLVKKAIGTDTIDSWAASLRSGHRVQAREVRYLDARCAERSHGFRADLPGPGPEQREGRGPGEGGGAADEGAPVRSLLPFVAVHQ